MKLNSRIVSIFIVFAGIFSFLIVLEAAMVPSNILQRVFSIRVESEQATAFTIEIDDRQYLITAKHVVLSSPSEIEIYFENAWLKVPIKIIEVQPANVDIAVLVLPQQLSPLLPIKLGIKDSFLSEEVYFVGFPFGLSIEGQSMNGGFPLPLVKHGIISAFANGSGEPFLVDGINNPGFSGGPVVNVRDTKNPTIIGVVSGYKAIHESVYKEKTKTNDLTIQTNTGLLVAYGMEYVIEAIKMNPIGFPVESAP